jgi:cytochrome c
MKTMLLAIAVLLATSSLYAQALPKDSTKAWFNISDSSSFKGKYKMEGVGFDYVEVTVKDSSLFFSGGEYAGVLTPLNNIKDTFDALGQAVFTFTRNAAGEVELVKIDYSGGMYEGKKEKPEPAKSSR